MFYRIHIYFVGCIIKVFHVNNGKWRSWIFLTQRSFEILCTNLFQTHHIIYFQNGDQLEKLIEQSNLLILGHLFTDCRIVRREQPGANNQPKIFLKAH